MGAVLFDHAVQAVADDMGYHYTRYADDLNYSCDEDGENHRESSTADVLVEKTTDILAGVGFQVAHRKTKFMRSKSPKLRQQVLGLVVNKNVGPDDAAFETEDPFVRVSYRKTYRLIRVMLHNAMVHGVEEAARKRGESGVYYFAKVQSYIKSFLGQCDRRRHDKLIGDLNLVKAVWENELGRKVEESELELE
jgi:hypothetical protein